MQSDVVLLRPRSSSTQRPIDEALATILKYVYKASPLTQVQANVSSGVYPVVDVISPVTYSSRCFTNNREKPSNKFVLIVFYTPVVNIFKSVF